MLQFRRPRTSFMLACIRRSPQRRPRGGGGILHRQWRGEPRWGWRGSDPLGPYRRGIAHAWAAVSGRWLGRRSSGAAAEQQLVMLPSLDHSQTAEEQEIDRAPAALAHGDHNRQRRRPGLGELVPALGCIGAIRTRRMPKAATKASAGRSN